MAVGSGEFAFARGRRHAKSRAQTKRSAARGRHLHQASARQPIANKPDQDVGSIAGSETSGCCRWEGQTRARLAQTVRRCTVRSAGDCMLQQTDMDANGIVTGGIRVLPRDPEW